MNRKATTLVETMIVMILLVVLLTSIWRVYSATQKNAVEIMANHQINDELDRTLIKITDDIREANAVDKDYPPIYELSEIESIKTEDEKNQLVFTKVNYDFSQDPNASDKGLSYTSNKIKYFVEKEDPTNQNSKWMLNREMTPFDENDSLVESDMTIHNILNGIDECIFYRIKDPDATRTGNIYIHIKMGRKDDGKYTNESTISVKERGAMPTS